MQGLPKIKRPGPVLPNPKAAVKLLDEPFNTDLAAYTADFGTSKTGLVVSGGQLSSSDSNDHSMHAAFNVPDVCKMMVKASGISGSNHTVALWVKNVDDNNIILAQFLGGAFNLYKRVAGSYVVLSTFSHSTAISVWWLVVRLSGNTIVSEMWSSDPLIQGTKPALTATAVLTGADATALGAGVNGKPGLRLTGNGGAGATPVVLDDWIVAVPAAAARTDF